MWKPYTSLILFSLFLLPFVKAKDILLKFDNGGIKLTLYTDNSFVYDLGEVNTTFLSIAGEYEFKKDSIFLNIHSTDFIKKVEGYDYLLKSKKILFKRYDNNKISRITTEKTKSLTFSPFIYKTIDNTQSPIQLFWFSEKNDAENSIELENNSQGVWKKIHYNNGNGERLWSLDIPSLGFLNKKTDGVKYAYFTQKAELNILKNNTIQAAAYYDSCFVYNQNPLAIDLWNALTTYCYLEKKQKQ